MYRCCIRVPLLYSNSCIAVLLHSCTVLYRNFLQYTSTDVILLDILFKIASYLRRWALAFQNLGIACIEFLVRAWNPLRAPAPPPSAHAPPALTAWPHGFDLWIQSFENVMCGKQLMQSGIYSTAYVMLLCSALRAVRTVHIIFDSSVAVLAH